jgi:hypothetical protein
MTSKTPVFGLTKPTVNDLTDADLWGYYLNDDLDREDGIILPSLNDISSSKSGDFIINEPDLFNGDTADSNKVFLCNCTSNNIAALLPKASSTGSGFKVAFKKLDSSVHTLTIEASGTDRIDGLATKILSLQYDSAVLISDGSANWSLIEKVGLAPIDSPNFTGTPTAPTPSQGDSTTDLATTGFVNGTALTLTNGTTAITQTYTDNTPKVATNAFVQTVVSTAVSAISYVSKDQGAFNVGSFCFCANTGFSNLNANDIVGGSDLRPAGINPITIIGTGSSLAGSWRCLGQAPSNSPNYGTLYQRVA